MAVRDKLAEAGISDNRILANFGRKEIPQKIHPKVDLTKVNEHFCANLIYSIVCFKYTISCICNEKN